MADLVAEHTAKEKALLNSAQLIKVDLLERLKVAEAAALAA